MWYLLHFHVFLFTHWNGTHDESEMFPERKKIERDGGKREREREKLNTKNFNGTISDTCMQFDYK